MSQYCSIHQFYYSTTHCPFCMDEKYYATHTEQILKDTMDNTRRVLSVPVGKGFTHYFQSLWGPVTVVHDEEETPMI